MSAEEPARFAAKEEALKALPETAGVVTEYQTGITAESHPNGIAAGPDGNI